MKLLILYFSGTGNTNFIASYIYSHLTQLSLPLEIKCDVIENFPPEKVADFDLLCFGFPIFELNCPEIVKNYLNKILVVEKKGLFFFATMGIAAGNAFRKVYRIFKEKGYIPLGHVSVKMPGTDGLAMMDENSKYIKKALKRDYNDQPEVDEFVSGISKFVRGKGAGQKIDNYKIKLPFHIFDFLFGWLFHLLYLGIVKFMEKRFHVDDSCIHCGLCVKICPVENIFLGLNEEIQFKNKCTMCLRCIHQCPTNSIQIGKLTVNKFRWKGPGGKFDPLKMLKN